MANRSDSSVSPSAFTPAALAALFVQAIATAVFSVPVWAWSRLRLVGTHGGVFHADDLVATALLDATGSTFNVLRTRDEVVLDRCDITYDVAERRYDHHGSRSGNDPCGVPWCGATRLWFDGLCEALMPCDPWGQAWFYANVLAPIAWQDNGQAIPAGYMHHFQWVHQMNPLWNDMQNFDERFRAAQAAAGPIVKALLEQAHAASQARAVLENLPDDDIVTIPAGIPDWQDFLAKCAAKFVIFEGTKDTPWYAQCVPTEDGGRFSKKCPFPADWAGRRGDDLSSVSGVANAVFCHINQFISGWKTQDDAKFACVKALQWD